MTLRSHLIAGVIGGAILIPTFGPLKSVVFFIASFLIDADHYLEYLYRVKKVTGTFPDWRPKQMFLYYDPIIENRFDKRNLGFSLLHTVEAFAVIILLAFYLNFPFLYMVIAGMAYHMIFDVVSLAVEKLHFVRSYSIFEHFIRMPHMKKKGFDPDEFYKDMYILTQKSKAAN